MRGLHSIIGVSENRVIIDKFGCGLSIYDFSCLDNLSANTRYQNRKIAILNQIILGNQGEIADLKEQIKAEKEWSIDLEKAPKDDCFWVVGGHYSSFTQLDKDWVQYPQLVRYDLEKTPPYILADSPEIAVSNPVKWKPMLRCSDYNDNFDQPRKGQTA